MNTELEKLEKQQQEIQKKINNIKDEEENKVQKPRCREMIGWCLKSDYGDGYAKIVEIVENETYCFEFLLEGISIGEDGEVSLTTTSVSPYLNKEWWKPEVPLSGWERISETDYKIGKMRLTSEFYSRKKLKKYTLKQYK